MTTYARGAKVKDGVQFRTDDRIRELTGLLLPNHKHSPHEPDYFGSICIEGCEFQLRAWNRTGVNGAPYIKIRCLRRYT